MASQDYHVPFINNMQQLGCLKENVMPSEQEICFCPSLVHQAWELIDPTPNIHKLFVQFNTQFFWNILAPVEVRWSNKMTSSAGVCSFNSRNKQCVISLSAPLLKLRPRKDLVETLLHEMIHAFLFLTNNDRDRDGHGPNFCEHMNRINKLAGTKISIYHNFHEEVKLYQQHWWKCDGPCRLRPPYFGTVRRAMNRPPGPSDWWWRTHQNSCNGKFIKVKEPENFKSRSKQTNGSGNSSLKSKSEKSITDWFSPSSSSSKGGSRLTSPEILAQTANNSNKMLARPGTSRDNDTNFPATNEKYTSHTSKKIGNSSNNVHGWGTGGPSNKPEKNNTVAPRSSAFSCSGILGGSNSGRSNLLAKYFTGNGRSQPTHRFHQSTDRESLPDTPSTSRQATAGTSLPNPSQPGNNSVPCPICNVPMTVENLYTHIDSCLINDNNDNIELIDELNNNVNNNNNELILPMPAAASSLPQNEDTSLSRNKRIRLEDDDILTGYVNCPVCNNTFPNEDINEHLDECLLQAETVHKEPIPSTSSASNDGVINISGSSGSDVDDSVVMSPVAQPTCDTNETDKEQRCLVCNAQIPLETSLNEHLEECIGDLFGDDKMNINDNEDEIDGNMIVVEDNATESKYPCPVCMQMISESLMNQHLDTCLKNEEMIL